ncbi:hypothetical protein [Lentzea atacamensis]|uniref:hypothetical protein n=1 Tax=Lentzea atacamensis TaxID=531938 RepID=UPI001C025A09|nr:hypothetical protein [Lentzea atacamensis]
MCRTELRCRWATARPASRRTEAWALADAAERPRRRASSVVVQPPAMTPSAAARVRPRSASSERLPLVVMWRSRAIG